MTFWTWLVFLGWPLLLVAWMYNRLVRHRNRVEEAWSGIDVQLRFRHDLIPNLVETVRGYAGHERNLLEELTRLRADAGRSGDPADTEEAETHLTETLRRLFAVTEAYPELKASENFLKLQEQLVEIEDRIQMARRYYNGSVRDYNTLVESFPSNLAAGLFGFDERDFFEIETATHRLVPAVCLEDEPEEEFP